MLHIAILLLLENRRANTAIAYDEACRIERNRRINNTRRRLSANVPIGPNKSPIQKLLTRGTDRDFIAYLGVNRSGFFSLLCLFQPLYEDTYMRHDGTINYKGSNHFGSRGRKCLLTAAQALAVPRSDPAAA